LLWVSTLTHTSHFPAFNKTIRLSNDADMNSVAANFKNGVLKVCANMR